MPLSNPLNFNKKETMMITCPVCGRQMKTMNRTHLALHNLSAAEYHSLRLEAEYRCSITDLLQTIYIEQALSSPQIFSRYGITYRVLRELLHRCNISMRQRSDAVAASWAKDDGSRRLITSQKMRDTMSKLNLSGADNPAKRPEVARKISAAKVKSNPGLLPMMLGHRKRRLANPSPLEVAMRTALDNAGILYIPEYQQGRYFIDIALPSIQVGIECDGRGWHDAKVEYDASRDAWLAEHGWHIFRFTQVQIQTDPAKCVQDLITKLNELGITPPTT
jgi:very-short-patch-repair endonuclease